MFVYENNYKLKLLIVSWEIYFYHNKCFYAESYSPKCRKQNSTLKSVDDIDKFIVMTNVAIENVALEFAIIINV